MPITFLKKRAPLAGGSTPSAVSFESSSPRAETRRTSCPPSCESPPPGGDKVEHPVSRTSRFVALWPPRHTRGARLWGEPSPQPDSGAVMVEMAFMLTLLVMLLVGVTTSAIAFGQNNSIENAAREASRYGATLPGPIDTTWLGEVRDVARAAALGELEATVDGQYICVAHYDGSAWARLTDSGGVEVSGTSSCFTDSLPPDQPHVQIVTRRDTTINGIVFAADITLEGQAAARYER